MMTASPYRTVFRTEDNEVSSQHTKYIELTKLSMGLLATN